MSAQKFLQAELRLLYERRGPGGYMAPIGDFIDATGDCWEWLGSTTDGYGRVMVDGVYWQAHRLVYSMLVGEIPQGMVTDHLCRNRVCVNPDHIEIVTRGENSARGARRLHCKNGHWLKLPEHRYEYGNTGHVVCRTCRVAAQREKRAL